MASRLLPSSLFSFCCLFLLSSCSLFSILLAWSLPLALCTVLFLFHRSPPFRMPTHLLLVSPLSESHFLSLILQSLPSPFLVLPCCASVIPTLPPFLSLDCMYPSSWAWNAMKYLAGHILFSSICWLALRFHFIDIIIFLISLFPCYARSLAFAPPICVITFVSPQIRLLS